MSQTVVDHSRFWDRVDAVTIGTLAAIFLFGWLIFPMPRAEDLQEVTGKLASYSIEPDSSWFARNIAQRRKIYALFALENQPGRFWNDAVYPANASSVFPRRGVLVTTFRDPHSRHTRINGNGEKTFGLMVDGVVVQNAGDAVEHDTILEYLVLPLFGVGALGFAVWKWRRAGKVSTVTSA
jgi:hypothetical protein